LHTLLYLITFNLLYPNEVLLLRGNHEEITLSEQGGFASRILSKFDQEILNEFYGFFAKLPLAHMIDSNYLKLFATHGGIPINVKDSRRIINIRKVVLDCFKGKITDMDPYSQQLLSNIAINKVWKSKSYKKMNGNPGYEYTEKIFTNFMLKNKIDMMFCGNQVLKSGHQYQFSDQLLCLFSALSYKGDKYPGKIVEIMFPSDPEYPDEENIAPSEEDEEDEDEDEIFYVDEFSDGTPSDQPVNGHQIEENANGNQTNTEVSETQENDQNEQGEEEEISVTVNLLEISKLS
jgi:hypothetical protein